MKKHFALTFLSIPFFLFCKSQIKQFEYGFQGGPNVNTANGTAINNDNRDNLVGFNIGGHFKINTSNQFGIKAKLQYEQNGWTYRDLFFEGNNGSGISKGDVIFKLNYLNLPLLAEWSFGKKIKFYTDAGMFFGVLLNNQVIFKIQDPLPPNQITTTTSHSDSRKSTNFGISGGAGVQFPFSSAIKLNVDLIDNYGLQNINKHTGSTITTTTKTNSLSLSVGITVTP